MIYISGGGGSYLLCDPGQRSHTDQIGPEFNLEKMATWSIIGKDLATRQLGTDNS